MKIIDLAEVIAPKCKREVIGIRPGEKINEVLLTEEETHHTKEFNNYFVVEPEHHFWGKENYKEGKSLPSNFTYTSDNNDHWLTKAELDKMLEEL